MAYENWNPNRWGYLFEKKKNSVKDAILYTKIALVLRNIYEKLEERHALSYQEKVKLEKGQLGRIDISNNEHGSFLSDYRLYLSGRGDWGFELISDKRDFNVVNRRDSSVIFYDKAEGYALKTFDGMREDKYYGLQHDNQFTLLIEPNNEKEFGFVYELTDAVIKNDKEKFMEISSRIREYHYNRFEKMMAERGVPLSESYIKTRDEEKAKYPITEKFCFQKPNQVSLKVSKDGKEKEVLENNK